MQTHLLAPLSSNLTPTEKPGGSVTNVQTAICTAGLLMLLAEAMARAAHIAQEGRCANTTPCAPRLPWLLQSCTPPRMPSAQKMLQPTAASQLSGSVKPAAIYGPHALLSGLHEEMDAQYAADAPRPVHGSNILLWLQATILCWLSGTTPAMLPWAIFLTTQQHKAEKKCSGCAPTARQDKSTATQQGLTTELANMPQAVLSVLVTRLASATRCRHTTHSWLQNGILPRMRAHLMTTLHTLTTWLGGHLSHAETGSKAFLSVQLLLIVKGRGGLSNSMACR